MRLLHTMKTDSLLKLIRQTPIRHWDNGKVESIRCSTSSSLYLQIGDGATLLPSDVNAKGYYPFPSNTAMSEVCVRLPRDDETPTYDFMLELCRILAQSREGYFESDHLCAKSLPMLMMVLENEAQTERFKSAVSRVEVTSFAMLSLFVSIVYTTLAGSYGTRQLSLSTRRPRRIPASRCILPRTALGPCLCTCTRQTSGPRSLHRTQHPRCPAITQEPPSVPPIQPGSAGCDGTRNLAGTRGGYPG